MAGAILSDLSTDVANVYVVLMNNAETKKEMLACQRFPSFAAEFPSFSLTSE